jgi:hypothetical protein
MSEYVHFCGSLITSGGRPCKDTVRTAVSPVHQRSVSYDRNERAGAL